jgi:hypothetical protein
MREPSLSFYGQRVFKAEQQSKGRQPHPTWEACLLYVEVH